MAKGGAMTLLAMATLGLVVSGAWRTYARPAERLLSSAARFHRGLVGGTFTLSVAALLGILAAQTMPPTKTFFIDPATVTKREGHAFATELQISTPWPYVPASDAEGVVLASRLDLFEDGKPLGPGHLVHTAISQKGKGSFSHWKNMLVFSSSDGSDVRTNGRAYGGRVTLKIRPAVWKFIVLVMLLTGFFLFRPTLGARLAWLLGRTAPTTKTSEVPATGVFRFKPLTVALAACAIAVGIVVFNWAAGRSMTFGIAGFLPVSDALGYYRCATSIGASSDFPFVNPPAEWCGRRVLYPSMLATMLAISGWHPHITLLCQAALVGLSISALSSAAARSVGRLAAIFAFFILFFYAREFALSVIVTEVAGLSAGLAGIALLLHYASGNTRLPLLLAGLGLVSVGMTARAGALFILPALVCWSWWTLRNAKPRAWIKPSLAALGAVLTGPTIHLSVLLALGIDPHNTGGNFSVTLYGLSTGSRVWSQAYRDHAQLFQNLGEVEAFRQIYAIALDNIIASPQIFLTSLVQAGQGFIMGLFAFGPLTAFNSALSVLFWIGLLQCLRRWRDPVFSLLLLTALGELVSAPFIIDSGGQRVFAVSVAARILIAGLGLQLATTLLGRLLLRSLSQSTEKYPVPADGIPWLPVALGGFILGATLLPITPAARLFHLSALSGRGCPTESREVIVRLDRESQSLGIVGQPNEQRILPLHVTQEKLTSDPHLAQAWYGDGFRKLRSDTLVVYAFQRLHEGFGTFHYVISQGSLPVDATGTFSLCVDSHRVTQLGDFHFQRVVSMKQINK